MSKETGAPSTPQAVVTESEGPKKGKKRKRAGPANGASDEKLDQVQSVNEGSGPIAPNTASRKAQRAGAARNSTEIQNQPSDETHKRQKSIASERSSTSAPRPDQKVRGNKTLKGNQQSKSNQGVPPHLSRKRDELLPIRKALPIWPQADAIKAALRKHNILVLTGETGSGKSTQVPQFLANESWCTKCIAITQPRRVAAISLARRVADEMGTFMGSQSPAAKVGYSVRFDNSTGPNTKIKFLTEGMLLQEMLRDSTMAQYSAIIVDEVHERSVNVDLILGFLRNLVSEKENGGKNTRSHPLKVVVMSATADVDSLVNFFEHGQEPTTPGHVAESMKARTRDDEAQQKIKAGRVATCFVEGRQYPVKTIYLPQPTQDWIETALKIIFQIHYKEPLPGDILVFLTGQDTIEGLEKLVNDYAEGMDKDVPKVRDVTAMSTTIFRSKRPYEISTF